MQIWIKGITRRIIVLFIFHLIISFGQIELYITDTRSIIEYVNELLSPDQIKIARFYAYVSAFIVIIINCIFVLLSLFGCQLLILLRYNTFISSSAFLEASRALINVLIFKEILKFFIVYFFTIQLKNWESLNYFLNTIFVSIAIISFWIVLYKKSKIEKIDFGKINLSTIFLIIIFGVFINL